MDKREKFFLENKLTVIKKLSKAEYISDTRLALKLADLQLKMHGKSIEIVERGDAFDFDSSGVNLLHKDERIAERHTLIEFSDLLHLSNLTFTDKRLQKLHEN